VSMIIINVLVTGDYHVNEMKKKVFDGSFFFLPRVYVSLSRKREEKNTSSFVVVVFVVDRCLFKLNECIRMNNIDDPIGHRRATYYVEK
jgi:hypothetical protein